MKTAIFVPTMGRANKIPYVANNIRQNTQDMTIYFIVEAHDNPSIRQIKNLGEEYIINAAEPCYAGAINTAYKLTKEPYFFTGADDLDFHPNWLKNALSRMTDKIQVIGTNDMGTIPIGEQRDSTHYLISRKYIQEQSGRVDAPNTVLYPYDHNYTDKEFIEIAKKRGVFAYAPDSEVAHNHWAWGKAQMDDTYRRGLASNERDRQLYMQRQHLWS